MKEIQAVIFDLYGTLIRIRTDEDDTEHVWKPLAFYFGYHGAHWTPEQLRQAYAQEVERRQREADRRAAGGYGEVQLEQVLGALLQKGGGEATPQTVEGAGMLLRACSTRRAELYPGARELLDALRGAGKQVYLLSNAQRLFTAPELRMLDLWGRFDRVFLSSDWGIKKPGADYFALALRECGCAPDRVLMVGNSITDDILPARKLGLRTCFLNTDGVPQHPDCDLACDSADYDTLLQQLLPETDGGL